MQQTSRQSHAQILTETPASLCAHNNLCEYTFRSKLMGCDAHWSIVTEDKSTAEQLFVLSYAVGREIEARFSRFSKDSELSRLNTSRSMIVSPAFADAFCRARELYQATNGVFNILHQVQQIGYRTDFERMPRTIQGPHNYTANLDLRAVEFDPQTRQLTLLEGQQLDGGGFIKGYAVEQMTRRIAGVAGVIVNVGGDVYALGNDATGMPFQFSLVNPMRRADSITVIAQNCAIATSGTYRRKWRYNGKAVHHLLGAPSQQSDLISATVLHARGDYADAYATTAMVLGRAKSEAWLHDQHVNYVLITNDGTVVSNM